MPKLSMYDRRKIAVMVDQGSNKTEIANALGVSRPTVYKWWQLYLDQGEDIFEAERTSKPHNSPQKIDPKLLRKIVQLAWRHPENGLEWYWEKIGKSTSKTTIHNTLNPLGLGSKRKRLGNVLAAKIKSQNALEYLTRTIEQLPLFLSCYNHRDQFAEKPQTEFICIEMTQRLRLSNRYYRFLFMIDTYDMSAKVVVNDASFFNEYHYLELQTVLGQNNLQTFIGHHWLPEILTWHKFLRNQDMSLNFIKFSYIEDEFPGHFSTLTKQLEPLSIPVAVESRGTMHAAPWLRSFIDQVKNFQKDTLNKKLFFDRYERRDIRLMRCTNLLEDFLRQYNSKAIDIYPFLGESPTTYRKTAVNLIQNPQYVGTVDQLRRTSDKSQALLRRPSFSSLLANISNAANVDHEAAPVN